MPDVRSMRDHKWLGAWDLADAHGKPRDVTVEIESVAPANVPSEHNPKGEKLPIVRFKGARKGMVLNKTNEKTIAAIAGSFDSERWKGLKITLFQTMVKATGGGKCLGVRVRPMRAQGAAEEMGDGMPVDAQNRAEQEAAMNGEEGDEDK